MVVSSDHPKDANVRSHGRGIINVVRRGQCGFWDKAVNQRLKYGADAVIVINSLSDDLFLMSSAFRNPEKAAKIDEKTEVPPTILLTKSEGKALLDFLNGCSAPRCTARSTIRIVPQDLEKNSPLMWPLVKTSSSTIQILASSGWGLHAVKANATVQPKDDGSSYWQLFVVKQGQQLDWN